MGGWNTLWEEQRGERRGGGRGFYFFSRSFIISGSPASGISSFLLLLLLSRQLSPGVLPYRIVLLSCCCINSTSRSLSNNGLKVSRSISQSKSSTYGICLFSLLEPKDIDNPRDFDIYKGEGDKIFKESWIFEGRTWLLKLSIRSIISDGVGQKNKITPIAEPQPSPPPKKN